MNGQFIAVKSDSYVCERGQIIFINDNNELHKTDGPAISEGNRKAAGFYINGIDLDIFKTYNNLYVKKPKELFNSWMLRIKALYFNLNDDDIRNIDDNIIRTKLFFKDGVLHRDDGPAYIDINNTYIWYKNGQMHRLDGPAWLESNYIKLWYIEGKHYTKEEFHKQCKY